jgi:aminoglycoside phosphotransferase family enzyme
MIEADDHPRRWRSARFRFYEELNDFLPEKRRKVGFSHGFEGTPSVKDTIQAIGVPHGAIDLILVDGRSVGFDHRLHGGERVAVYPVFERLDISPIVHLRPEPLRKVRFALDVHLGKLARHLRMLGFDTAWEREWDDADIIDCALNQKRIILTRDLGILKQSRVTHGYWLRSHQPMEQVVEVLEALDLMRAVKPFTRCLECNGKLEEISQTDAASATDDLVDPEILNRFNRFWCCKDCRKIYWRGSHFERMLQKVRLIAGESLIRQLQNSDAFPHPVSRFQLVETHISWVLLTGDFAYKIKKPVVLGFLDFSTLEKRGFFCREELRVNRRTAPDLYLDVVPIGTTSDGVEVGAEPAIEYALKMRQFPHDSRLDRRLKAGALGPEAMGRLAASIADFHDGLEPRAAGSAESEAGSVIRPARNNFRHLDTSRLDDRSKQQLAVIEAWTHEWAEHLKPVLAERARRGFIRECHGDLHLENLLMLNEKFVLFDGIEFNPELRWIDTANDIAFLVMDLLARGFSDLAFVLLNAWLERTGDYDSLAVMRFYLMYRSMVRAVVTSIRQRQTGHQDESFRLDASRYIGLAASLSDTPAPRLFLMHGFSGSGKTWLSERMVGRLPALRVRSDVERKRPHGRSAGQAGTGKIGTGLYRSEARDQTYRVLERHCATGLRAGFHMIADATFLLARHRAPFFEMAQRTGAELTIVDCGTDIDTLRERVSRREAAMADESDAGLNVLEHQLIHYDDFNEHELQSVVRVPVGESPDSALALILSALPRRWPAPP